jgi:CBS-domain-containing membrane protein
MTGTVVTIGPEAPVARAARALHEHHVKRLPVVDGDGKVVGIVSRSDLLSVFLRPDRDIADDIDRALTGPTPWTEPGQIRVIVADGVATLEGLVELRSQIPIVVGIARAVDGVVDVVPRLRHELDDVTSRLEVVTPWGVYPPTAGGH